MRTYRIWEASPCRTWDGVLLAESLLPARFPWLAAMLAAGGGGSLVELDLVTDSTTVAIRPVTGGSSPYLGRPRPARHPARRRYSQRTWGVGHDPAEAEYPEAEGPIRHQLGAAPEVRDGVLGYFRLQAEGWCVAVELCTDEEGQTETDEPAPAAGPPVGIERWGADGPTPSRPHAGPPGPPSRH